MTPRWRIVAILALACVVGYIYFGWALELGRQILASRRRRPPLCRSNLDGWLHGCGPEGFNAWIGWADLAVVSVALLVAGVLLARWALRPLRTMTETVQRLGPTSLGLRLHAVGPRDETRQLADSIDAMLGRLAEGYEAQRRFAANASHELRTPLATQRALIEVSLADELNADQLQLLSRQLLATNERNEQLVDGLLALAETERGLVSAGPVPLARVVCAAADSVRPAAERAGVALRVDATPVTVTGEAALLQRLVVNLLTNAVKYNDAGGSVHATIEASGRMAVTNTGPRVPAEEVPALFEPFRRLGGDRLDHGGGVGLGLTIARSIVAAHAGSIRATANPRGGLTVEVQLAPIVPVEPATAGE